MILPTSRFILIVLSCMILGGFVAWLAIRWLEPTDQTDAPATAQQPIAVVEPVADGPKKPAVPTHTPAPQEPQGTSTVSQPKVAIVIDDVGLRPNVLDAFWAIPSINNGLSWAVIPGARFANALTHDLVTRKACIIAHIPMEPIASESITSGLGDYLMLSDGPTGMLDKLRARMDTFPASLRSHVTGLSNHQGSLLTTNRSAMMTLIKFARSEKLFFFDSRTTAATIGISVAHEQGVRVVERNVFLDNVREPDAIERQLDELLSHAQRKGSAVGIGHPYPETAVALARWLHKHASSLQLVPVSALTQ
jgi:polysaccharide deacetylase 2 family uncharacterized protein YibQ